MTNSTAPTHRSGQSEVSREEASIHTLVVCVEDRPGSIDRVIGVLRRRRSNLQMLTLGRSEQNNLVRITAVVNDSEVRVDQLLEQLRKIADVRQADILAIEQLIARELALLKVNSTPDNFQEIIEAAQLFGAHAVDMTPETVTLEVTGSAEKIEQVAERLQQYGIREIARSGYVTMTRESGTTK